MDAGKLTTPIGIYRNKATQSDTGYTPDDWKKVCSRRAHVISQKGGKALNSGSVWYPTARVIKVRKPLDIDESCRIEVDGAMYEIINIDRLAKDSITINCEQVHEC